MRFDLVFAGGGLSACLTALRIADARPDLSLVVVETQDALAGDHFWSFHDADVPPGRLAWLRPLVAHHWDAQRVVFPGRERVLATGYNSVTAERLREAVAALPNVTVLTGTPAARVDPDGVTLADQTRLSGTVLDARGASPSPHLTLGFQKFLGQHVRTVTPHGVTIPTIMDATVPQTDGYRFVYVLPLSADVLHVEDTYYADGDDLPKQALRAEIASYCERQGWDVAEVIREEDGVLPIVLEGDVDAYFVDLRGQPAPIGMRAVAFNPITGYSLPVAAELADRLVDLLRTRDPDPGALFSEVEAFSKAAWRSHAFYRLLNRMMFRAAPPQDRWIILRRHYGLSRPLIERFYAGRSTLADKARILAGKPPVPLHRAVAAMRPQGRD